MEGQKDVDRTQVRAFDNGEKVEAEPEDPEEAKPAYTIQVTLSPKTFDRRDSRPGDPLTKEDILQIEENISRQKRYCFFESHEHMEKQKTNKFYAKRENEEFLTWPDKDDNYETFYHIVLKDTMRKFLVAFCKRWPVPHHASEENNIADQYEPLLEVINGFIDERTIPKDIQTRRFNALVCRDYVKILAGLLPTGLAKITVNQRLQIINYFHETCPFVKEHDEAPVFCLEAAGRDEFVVTTYGFAPQEHALFPGVPLQLQSATGLQYTLVLHLLDLKRRLVMLDPSLPADAEE